LWEITSIAINDGEKMQSAKTLPADTLQPSKEVAKLLGVSDSWLAKSRLTGTGPPFVKVGRAVRYRLSAVQDYIKARTRASTTEA
jgi:predicted DNA-binding transcriptional regulator AlpA